MSVLKKFTNEQIAAFQECKTQEELIAKANELGVEYSEEDLKEAVELLGTIETLPAESGELDIKYFNEINKDNEFLKTARECISGKENK